MKVISDKAVKLIQPYDWNLKKLIFYIFEKHDTFLNMAMDIDRFTEKRVKTLKIYTCIAK